MPDSAFLYIGATFFKSTESSELCKAMPRATLGWSTWQKYLLALCVCQIRPLALVSIRQQNLLLCISLTFPLSVMKLHCRTYTKQYILGDYYFLSANFLLAIREIEWIIKFLRSLTPVIFLNCMLFYLFHHFYPESSRNGLRSSLDRAKLLILVLSLTHTRNNSESAFLLHKSANRWSYTRLHCGQLLLV